MIKLKNVKKMLKNVKNVKKFNKLKIKFEFKNTIIQCKYNKFKNKNIIGKISFKSNKKQLS